MKKFGSNAVKIAKCFHGKDNDKVTTRRAEQAHG